ncbi:unnamed protein product [Diatraea saccharalis]|uniref:Mutant cadherin n=1 Tax=Diatraea saccharalis TaxID=40085 RepID=A0A9N9WHS3_9NEOP|nr:unnamed protein product [Diatraea saccharalis]
MDNESLIKICVSEFSEKEIEDAKTLLFESVQKEAHRKVSRRKGGKTTRNVEDIICFFKEVDPDCVPIFVARDLQKLPPISFDHIDAVSILKDITKLRNDMNNFKEKYATLSQVQELQNDLESVKLASSYNYQNVNTGKRGAYLLESGPIGLLPSINNCEGRPVSAVQNSNGCTDDNAHRKSCSRINAVAESASRALSVSPKTSATGIAIHCTTAPARQHVPLHTTASYKNGERDCATKEQCKVKNPLQVSMADME